MTPFAAVTPLATLLPFRRRRCFCAAMPRYAPRLPPPFRRRRFAARR